MAKKIEEGELVELNSPFSRVYACPETDYVMNCAMGLKHSIDLDALKAAISSSLMIRHPRFRSLLVTDHRGRHHWKNVPLNIDDHLVILHHHPTAAEDDEKAINAYLSDLAMCPMSKDKPLWELQVLVGLKCVILRVHHSVGDGLSVMTMLKACFGQKRVNGFVDHQPKKQKHLWEKGVWSMMKTIWLSLVFGARLGARNLWVRDEETAISGGDAVDFWPRKLVTIKFKLEDMQSIKKAIPKATANDVLLGLISCGLSRYLNAQSPKGLRDGMQITAIVPVNLRQDSKSQLMSDDQEISPLGKESYASAWTNKIGLILFPIYYSEGDVHPLQHVRRAKKIMDQKKQTFEAQISEKLLSLITSCLGAKVGSWICGRTLSNTTLIISNIMGPQEEISIAGNPVTFIRLNLSSMPQAITLHMVSYAGRADLQVMVAKDIIHDPEFLANCFENSFLEMKKSVMSSSEVQVQKKYY